MRSVLTTVHRWTGGLIGLFLALLGLTGTLLLWKALWISVPLDTRPLGRDATLRLIEQAEAMGARNVVLASPELGVTRFGLGEKGGAYVSADGAMLDRWETVTGRLDTLLFDIHHHLLLGDTGTSLVGILGLIGLGFVVTGLILWWPSRRSFSLRAWPQRNSRPAIIRQHRDLGVVAAPLLILAMLTGAMMAFKPLSAFLTAPLSPAADVVAYEAKFDGKGGAKPAVADWPVMLAAADARFPDAALRVVVMPRKPGDFIQLRLRQTGEWHPNGRTTLRFDPATAALVDVRDAVTAPLAVRVRGNLYPLHAGFVGGLAYNLVMTLIGLALVLMGTLTMWSFWWLRRIRPMPEAVAAG